jgi:hypothetical protein
VLSVLPDADIGPGNILDPVKNKQRGAWGLEIIDHCATGTNYATGETGTPMKFFASSYYTAVGVSDERFETVIQAIREKLALYPQFAHVPVEIHEFGVLSEVVSCLRVTQRNLAGPGRRTWPTRSIRSGSPTSINGTGTRRKLVGSRFP